MIDRVMKLIALTASPNAHEAEAAAVKACAYIREHGLVFAGAAAPEPATPRVIPRCKRCGDPSANETGICTKCQRAGFQAIWRVTCASCGAATAPAPSERAATLLAIKGGFVIDPNDGRTLCRYCGRMASRA